MFVVTTIFSFPTNPFAVSPSFLLHSLVNAITQYPKHLLPLSARYKSYIDKQLYYILFLLRSLHVLLDSLTLLSSSRLHFALLFSLYNEPQLVLSPCREQTMHLFILQQQRSVFLSLSSFIPSRFALIFFNPLLHKKWYNAFKRAIFLSNTAVSYV